MNGFENMTVEGQRRLWLEIADRALRCWKMSPRRLEWLGQGGKAVLKARTDAGDFVLRLHPPGSLAAERLGWELRWLSSIRRNTGLLAPLPVEATVAGRRRLFLELRHEQLPPPSVVFAALFEFIEGELKPARDLSEMDVYRIGEYLGGLHTRAQFVARNDFEGPRLDWAGFFGGDSPYAAATDGELLSADELDTLDAVAGELRTPMTDLARRPEASGLIHADLLAKNVVFRRDAIAALDFEFCAWGFYLYDLAPLLWQLKGERAPDYPELEAAMWRGYTSARALEPGDRGLLETFIAARQAASIRWLLAHQLNPTVRQLSPSLIAQRCAELRGFLKTGCLRRSTPTL